MKILYLDAFSGVSGNMFLGALLDAGLDFDAWREELSRLSVKDYAVRLESVSRNAIRAKHLVVEPREKDTVRHLEDIQKIIEASSLSPRVKRDAVSIFTNLAEAEASVHGTTIQEVHFHEVGAVDAIVDIVGAVIALEMLGITRIICSPVRTGWGLAKMAHGSMPIPAPATALLLQGVPTYAGDVQGEFTTPTGAAIIKTLSHSFAPQPIMTLEKTGNGAGTRECEHPNILRAFIGTEKAKMDSEPVWVLETDVDDLTPEIMAYVQDLLLQSGALDATLTPIHMKKGRPGVRFTVLSADPNKENLMQILFEETSTLGVRESLIQRKKLIPQLKSVSTSYGPIEAKIITRGNGQTLSPEYESCKQAARLHHIPLQEVYFETIAQYSHDQSNKATKAGAEVADSLNGCEPRDAAKGKI